MLLRFYWRSCHLWRRTRVLLEERRAVFGEEERSFRAERQGANFTLLRTTSGEGARILHADEMLHAVIPLSELLCVWLAPIATVDHMLEIEPSVVLCNTARDYSQKFPHLCSWLEESIADI